MKRALITGVTGQDGRLLTSLLAEKGYKVYGTSRGDRSGNCDKQESFVDGCTCFTCDITDVKQVEAVMADTRPDEVYHLAAQSVVSYSKDKEEETLKANVFGTQNVLSACRKIVPQTRLFFAGSSEMFGNPMVVRQDESTPMEPCSMYGISKVAGYHILKLHREYYNLFGVCGFLYNHESPYRGMEFVTRKITSHVAKIKLGKSDKLELGNLDAKRDWSCAREVVYAMWLMLQHDEPIDLVLSSGRLHSVRELCNIAFSHVGLNYQDFVVFLPEYYREEFRILHGDPSKAGQTIGWKPSRDFKEIITEMVDNDLAIESSK